MGIGSHGLRTPTAPVTAISTPAPTLTWIGSAGSRTNATIFDWGNFVFGSDGLAIVLGFGRTTNNVTHSSIAIGASNATLVFAEQDGDANTTQAIGVLAITSGTYDIKTTYSGGTGATNYSTVGVWLLTNYLNAVPISGQYNGVTSTSNPITLQMPRGSVATYFMYHANTNDTLWDTATERADNVCASDRYLAYADYTNSTGIDNNAFVQTVSWTGSVSSLGYGAAWI